MGKGDPPAEGAPDKPLYKVRSEHPVPPGDGTRIRIATPEHWESANPVLERGEFGYDGTLLKIGDGTTNWNDLSPVGDRLGLDESDVQTLIQLYVSLDNLNNVSEEIPEDQEVLTFDAGEGRWRPLPGGGGGGGGATTLDELTDVNAATPEDQQALVWSSAGSAWTPQTISSGGGGGLEVFANWAAPGAQVYWYQGGGAAVAYDQNELFTANGTSFTVNYDGLYAVTVDGAVSPLGPGQQAGVVGITYTLTSATGNAWLPQLSFTVAADASDNIQFNQVDISLMQLKAGDTVVAAVDQFSELQENQIAGWSAEFLVKPYALVGWTAPPQL